MDLLRAPSRVAFSRCGVLLCLIYFALGAAGCQAQSTSDVPSADTLWADTVQADTVQADTVQTDARPGARSCDATHIRHSDDAPSHPAVDGDTVAWPLARVQEQVATDPLWEEALRIHFNALVVDGHIDTPTLMVEGNYDLSRRHSSNRSHVDLPRMETGGLDAAFFSLYVAPYYGEGARAVARAQAQIEAVRSAAEKTPDRLRRSSGGGLWPSCSISDPGSQPSASPPS